MSLIFLSHSAKNNGEAVALRDWLIEKGWSELFLDLDPERGLKAGQRWQQALKQAAERCEVVICLISPAWVVSRYCLAEFLLAKQLNKVILGVIVAPMPLAEIPPEMTSVPVRFRPAAPSQTHNGLSLTLPSFPQRTLIIARSCLAACAAGA